MFYDFSVSQIEIGDELQAKNNVYYKKENPKEYGMFTLQIRKEREANKYGQPSHQKGKGKKEPIFIGPFFCWINVIIYT